MQRDGATVRGPSDPRTGPLAPRTGPSHPGPDLRTLHRRPIAPHRSNCRLNGQGYGLSLRVVNDATARSSVTSAARNPFSELEVGPLGVFNGDPVVVGFAETKGAHS